MLKKILVVILAIVLALCMLVPSMMAFAEEEPVPEPPVKVEESVQEQPAAPPPQSPPAPAPQVPTPALMQQPIHNQRKEPVKEAKGDPRNLTILFTHDMHSHLEKFPMIATIAKEEREKDPDTILVDAGDFSMGTPFQTIFKTEASELRMMGSVGFDATTLGNHEFDYRPEGLAAMLNRAEAVEKEKKAESDKIRSYKKPMGEFKLPRMVNSNIDWEKTLADKKLAKNGALLQAALKSYGAEEYTVINKEGKKIAIFGIFGKQSAEYAPMSGTIFKDPVKSAKATVAKIRKNEKPDLIICLSHSGTNETDKSQSEDEILAKEVPDIDVIISGHSHTVLDEPIKIGKTLVVSCGEYNKNIGVLKLKRSEEKGAFHKKSYQIRSLDGVAADENTQEEVEKFKKLVDEQFFGPEGFSWDGKITTNSNEFIPTQQLGMKQGEVGLGNLLADSFVYAVKEVEGDSYEPIAVAVVNSGSIRGTFNKGDITAADGYNSLSLGTGKDGEPGYPIVSMYLTGDEIRAMAEVDATISEMMNEARLYMSGIVYRVNPHRLFLNKISEIYKFNGDMSSFHEALPYAAGANKDSGWPSRISSNDAIKTINKATQTAVKKGKLEKLEGKKLYRVVGDLYACQMMGAVTAKSKGLLAISPKDKNGKEITNFEDHIVYRKDGKELKEWYAPIVFLNSFGDRGIPAIYGNLQGRKIIEDVDGVVAYFKNPGRVMWLAIGVAVLSVAVLLLITIVIVKILRRIIYGENRRRRGRPTGLFGPSGASVYKRSRRNNSTIFKHRPNKYKTRWKR